jgi:hypothetical protein
MKLVMTLLARNEEDVIGENLLYHLNRGVDFVVATDNASDDSTREILAEYQRQGVLHLIDEPTHTYDQGRWVTRMARLAATDFGADWIINNDADEFFWPDVGDLKDVLAEIPERFGVLTVPRTNFLPRPESEEGGSVVDRMVVRERHSFATGEKRLPPKAVHRAHPEVSVENGGHRLAAPGLVTLDGWHPMETFHFPIRTYAQWEMKIKIAYEARTSANLNVYSTLRAGVALLEAGRLHEAYDELAFHDEQVETGVRAGRLVMDRRLQRFLAGVRARSGAALAASDRPGVAPAGGAGFTGARKPGFSVRAGLCAHDDLGGRSDALARAINAQGHEPIRNPMIKSLRARAKEGDKAVRRLRQIEAKRWVRFGQRVESAVAQVRDAGGGRGG